MEGTMSSSSSLHLKVKKALLVVAMLALYAAIRKGIYEDEDADEEEMGVLLCVVVVVGIARAEREISKRMRTDTAEHAAYSLESSNITLSIPCAYVGINLTLSRVTARQILGGCLDFTRR